MVIGALVHTDAEMPRARVVSRACSYVKVTVTSNLQQVSCKWSSHTRARTMPRTQTMLSADRETNVASCAAR